MRKIEISKKNIVLICVFLGIFLIGTVLMFITPIGVKAKYGKTIKTTDGVTISFNVFEPSRGGTNKKAIILGHGVMSNKEMLKDFAVEFAAAGFVAVPFDFRGHGQSTGEHTWGSLTNDIEAIVSYLNTRSDIDTSNLAYLGYSMGGVGLQVVNESTDFKCFIGAGTRLPSNIRKGNSTNPLNILMILGRYDELITPNDLKEGLSDYTGISVANIDVNKLYGSFEEGNAAKIYLDDLTNHVLGDWDPDFIMEAREFLSNSFSDVRPVDENYVVNTRLFILSLQLFGGFGFFILIVDPLSKLFLKPKEGEEVFRLDVEEESIFLIGGKTLAYSLVLGIPGIIIFVPILLILFLAVAGFVSALLFGQAFAIIVLLWRMGKKKNRKIIETLKRPFKYSRDSFLRQLSYGGILATILSVIIYLSGGLNYMGMIPSIIKIPWVPVFIVINFIIFLIYGILFHGVIQAKVEEGIKPLVKVSLMIFTVQFLYWFSFLFAIGLLMRSFFYFGSFLPFSIPMFLLNSFLSTLIYKKSGNIIAGALVNTLFFTLLICTISPYQSGLSFLLGFFF
ncbi:MAG: serine aminopeptidase domain-containing protein [Promethearchaeota archaeon]|jgi:dienelactone hydrolase/MFS family permease